MLSSLELKEFFTPGKTLDKGHVILHIAEPNAPHERERGVLFILFELADGTVGLIEECQKIIEYVEERYYSRDEKLEYVLERVLQAVNREYKEMLDEHALDISCIVGTIKDGDIQISYHGKPTVAVFFNQNNQINAMPIIEEENNGELFFSELISGAIGVQDFFYAATPHVLDYFPIDRIAKLLHDRPVKEVSTHIQKVLAEIGSDNSFGGLVAQVLRKTVPAVASKSRPQNVGSAASLNHLNASANATADTLSPPLLGEMKKTLQKIKDGPAHLSQLKPMRGVSPDSTKDHVLIGIGRGVVLAAQSLLRSLIGIIRSIGGVGIWAYRFSKSRSSRLEEINRLRSKTNYWKRTVSGLPTTSKVIGIGLIATVVIFLISLGYLRFHEYQTAKKEKVNNIAQAIIDKRDAAEASLLFEDKAKAQTLINEAQALLAQLPNESKKEKAKHDEMSGLILAVQDKLRNERRVTPELVADLGIVNSQNKAEKLTMFDSTLIAYGPNDRNWYFVNTVTKVVEGKQHESLDKLTEATPSNEGDLIVFRSETGELGAFDTKTQALTKKTISFPENNTAIATLEMYNRKLYTVDSVNKKMYRHNQTQGGYDQGEVWTKSGEGRLGGAISMAIDGDVYVLKENGEVRKWFRGEEQAFNLAAIDPALNSAQKIAVPDNGDEIFILDSDRKRIAVFDKNGNFREQLISEIFKKPTGMVVADGGKTIFVLDSGVVYKIVR